MTSLLSVIIVMAGTFGASLVVERTIGRSRKEMIKPGSLQINPFSRTALIFGVRWSIQSQRLALKGGAASLASGGSAALWGAALFQCWGASNVGSRW